MLHILHPDIDGQRRTQPLHTFDLKPNAEERSAWENTAVKTEFLYGRHSVRLGSTRADVNHFGDSLVELEGFRKAWEPY